MRIPDSLRHLTTALLLTLPLASQAGTVLEVNFSNLTAGVNATDGTRIQDTSGNGYHGFFGQTNATGSAVVVTATGLGIDNSVAANDGYVFIRDGLNGIPDPWDGPTTTITPYFNLDGSATGSWTMEAVLNWNSTTQATNGIMGQTGGNQIWFRESGGSLNYAIGAGDAVSAFGATIPISTAKTDGLFHSVALVYDGPAGEVRTYLDGALLHTNTDADIGTLPAAMLNNTGDFRLGSYNGNNANDFTGIMDQFRVSDTALTPAEFLTITSTAGADLTWTAAADTTWDVATTINWEDLGMVGVAFQDNDAVTFDDTAPSGTVVLSGSPIAPSSVTFNNPTLDYTLNGDGWAGGATTLTKTGAAKTTLLIDALHNGQTDIQAGTLQIGNGGSDGSLGGGAIVNDASLILNRDGLLQLNNAISGTGTLEVAGPGTVLLNGTSTYTGATTVSGGTLRLDDSLTSAVTVQSGATITAGPTTGTGTGTVPSLTLDAGSSASFRGGVSASDLLVVSDNDGLTIGGASTIDLVPNEAWAASDIFNIIDYTGTVTGFGNLSIGSAPHGSFLLDDDTFSTNIRVQILSLDTVVWTGTSSTAWDVDTTQNWQLLSDSSPANYFASDQVLFNDVASTGTVVLDGSRSPLAMTIDNSTVVYDISGAELTGATEIVKSGTADATIASANSTTGGTTITAGSLTFGDGATAGEIGTGTTTVTGAGSLRINRNDTLDYTAGNTAGGGSRLVSLSGDGGLVIDGGVNLVLNPGTGGDLDFDQPISWSGFTGPITIKGDSTLDTRRMGRTALGSGTVTLGDGSSSGSLATHLGNWTYTSDIDLVGSANEILNNNTTATNRYLKLQGVLSGSGGLTFVDLNGTMLDPNRGFILTGTNTLDGAVTIDFNTPIRVGGVPGDDFTATPGASGSLGTATVANDGFLTYSRTDAHQVDNAITGFGEVRIGLTTGGTETQVVTIGTSQAYSGDTIVNNGTLLVPTGVSLASDFVTVLPGGTLAGNGTLSGDVDVLGNVAPGASVGTLTSAGLVTLLADSFYTWEITTWGGTTPGTDFDLLLADTIDIDTLAPPANPITIVVTPDSLTGFDETNQTYTIATATTALTNFAADAFTVDASALVAATGTWAVQLSGDTLSLELAYTAGSASDYDTWAIDNAYWTPGDPNSGPTEDFDNDGLTNDEEYAFALDPTSAGSVSPITPLDNTTGTFTYTRRNPSLTGLTYSYEWSTTLTVPSWTTVVPAIADGVVPSGDNETVTVDLTGAPGDPLANPTLFVRVVATP